MKLPLSTRCAPALLAGAILVSASTLPAQVTTYHVDLKSAQFTLYTDPYNGNEIKVGGFSGIFPVPGRPDSFYIVSDRGPAPDFLAADGTAYKCWVIPGYGPKLLTVRLMPNGSAKIDEIKPLKRPGGGHISGLPTTKPATDVPYDFDLNLLPYDEDSIDAEGITIDPWGNFWVCEEYKPSVAMIAPNGKVQLRLIPAGTLTGVEEVPTFDVLPAVLAKRRNNRGFEGIAASADGTLYAILQRPLNNPNRAAADANGNVRIVAINLRTVLHGSPEPLLKQYLYRIATTPNNVTLSDLFSVAPGRLLVPERATDQLVLADLAGATDLTPLENADGRLIANPAQTIELLTTDELAAFSIVPAGKTVVLSGLTSIDPVLEKVEGVCVVGNSLVLTYDNDFNVGETASIPANPNPNGPQVQLDLLGDFFPKIFILPMP